MRVFLQAYQGRRVEKRGDLEARAIGREASGERSMVQPT